MKTSVYHIILLIFLNSFLFAQEIDIDSVARFYKKAQDKNILDAQTKREFNAISKYLEKDEYYFYRNIMSNIEATFRNDYERSYVILNELRNEKQKSKIHQAATLFETGAFFEKIHYHDKAVEYFKLCVEYLNENSLEFENMDPFYYDIFYRVKIKLSANYRRLGLFEDAKKNILPLIDKFDKNNEIIKLSTAIRQYTNVLYSEKKYIQAYNYFQRIDINRFIDYPNAIIEISSGKAYACFQTNRFKEAIELEKISLDARYKLSDDGLIINSIANILGFYIADNQIDSAKVYYNKLKNYFPLEHTHSILHIADVLSKYHTACGDTTSARFSKQIFINENKRKELSENMFSIAEYLVSEIDENNRIKNENSIYRLSIFLVILLLIVFFMLGVYYYIYNKKLRYQEKKLKEQIEQNKLSSQKIDEELRLKKKLIGILSHDLISPLSSSEKLMNMADELIQTDKDEIKTILKTCKNSINENIKILKNITKWVTSSIEENSFNPDLHDISELIDQVLSNFKTQIEYHKIDLNVNVPKNTVAFFDKEMINTVLRNLIQNAIKFSGAESNINIYSKQGSNSLRVYIKDSGIGMPQKIKENINDLHKLNNDEISSSSHGFGLKITNEFLYKNRGKLLVNDVDEGTEIYFTLPLYE